MGGVSVGGSFYQEKLTCPQVLPLGATAGYSTVPISTVSGTDRRSTGPGLDVWAVTVAK